MTNDYTPNEVLDRLIRAGWGEVARPLIPRDVIAAAYGGGEVRERRKVFSARVPVVLPKKVAICSLCNDRFEYTGWNLPRFCHYCRAARKVERQKRRVYARRGGAA